MKRTTIMLPARLKTQAEKLAREEGVSLGEFIRTSMEEKVAKSKGKERDPLFALDVTFKDDLPADVCANLDKYLDDAMDEEMAGWGKA